MFERVVAVGLFVVAVISSATMYAGSDEKEGTHEGVVASIEGDKLTMADKDGKNPHVHVVPASAAVTCDGQICRLQDLRKGMPVKVTIERQGDKRVVTRVDARKDAP